ncbi:MAG: redox-sensing transcriptional repressor Rex [Gemmatimonadota bacterium]|nr:MAG: redox-sensing transcriptional repressor Rex [Gemmatimonadota bacterium]
MSSPRKVSDSTVRRLSFYLRILKEIRGRGVQTVSSAKLAESTRVTSAQVRKDLSAFGNFGVRGRGYDVAELQDHILRILGLDRTWRTIVVGAGRLGSALTSSEDFSRQRFSIVSLFDNDAAKIGRRVGDAEVRPIEDLERFVQAEDIQIGIITTPAKYAQEAADRLARAGIRGILNFAPTRLEVADPVRLRNVNLAVELEGLTFAIADVAGDSA